MHKYLKVIVLPLVLLFTLSCVFFSLTGTPAVENTPTVTLALQSPEPSENPIPFAATETSLPPRDTPAPTSLNSAGPVIMFNGQDGVWITNPDGSFPTQVSRVGILGDLSNAISPRKDRMALVVQNDQGLDLVLVSIPGGESETIAHLISITPAEQSSDSTSQKAFAMYALKSNNGVAWQPGNGRLLAFTGAINGPTSDLYTYDTVTKETTQLTSGPSQAISPYWSPDGKYILNFGVSWVPPFGGAIGIPTQVDGVWAVRVSDGKIITLPKPNSINLHFVGWQDDSHYITFDSNDECFSINLRNVDVTSGEAKPIMDFSFYSFIAQSPENGALLFSSAAGCSTSMGEGVFLLLPGQTTPVKLIDNRAWEIDWLPESKLFNAYPEALFSSDGNTRYDPPVYDKSYHPAISKEGYQAWEVIENYQGRVMVKVPGGDWQTILNGFVNQIIWDPVEGKTVLVALEDGSLYAASFPNFTPRLLGNLGSMDQAIWMP
jgi:hypothetical protein